MKLSELTTMKTGGEVKRFYEVESLAELRDAVAVAKKNKLEILVVGEGSNILVSDEPINKVVVKLANKGIKEFEKDNVVHVTSGGGVKWDDLVKHAVDNNYQGIECLSYIPGLVGASPVQNIGAYGQELADSFFELEAYDVEREKLVTFDKESVEFGYRDSVFKKPGNRGRYIIFSVTLQLVVNGKPDLSYKSLLDYLTKEEITNPTLVQVREAVIAIRKKNLEDPTVRANAGSFFMNPVVEEAKINDLRKEFPEIPNFEFEGKYKIPAGWLIENSGWKGKRYGNVGVSEKHALVLVNPEGKGTAKEIIELSKRIQKDVEKKFGIKLEREVQYIN